MRDQVLTGESWSEVVARPILFGWDDYGPASIYLSTIFFISFVLVNSFILFNVFVAVLLDKVISPDKDLTDELDSLNEASMKPDSSPSPPQQASPDERASSPSEGSPPLSRKSSYDGGNGTPHSKLSASAKLQKLLDTTLTMHADVQNAVNGQEELREKLAEATKRLAEATERLERLEGVMGVKNGGPAPPPGGGGRIAEMG